MPDIKFYKHPDYIEKEPRYTEYRDLIEGMHDILAAEPYLWRHEFETMTPKGGTDLWAIRQKRTQYINWVRPIIQRYIALIFKQEPDLSEVSDMLGDEIEDIDGQGTSLTNFLQGDFAVNYFAYGKTGALVDSYQSDAQTRKEELERGDRPYVELVHPMQLLDWQRDRTGQYQWLRQEYTLTPARLSPVDEPTQYRYSRVLSLIEGAYVQQLFRGAKVASNLVVTAQQDANWTEEPAVIVPELEEIPIALAENESWLRHLVAPALLLHNSMSALDNQLLYSAHQRIIATGDFSSDDAIVMAVGTVTLIKQGNSITTVEPANPVALFQRINQLVSLLIQIAFARTRVLAIDSKAVEAADTQAEAKDEFLATLVAAGRDLEDCANTMIRHYAAFKGVKDFTGRIKFNLDITQEDINQQLNIMQAFYSDIKQHELWYKETLKQVAGWLNPGAVDEIKEEIDAAAAPAEQGAVSEGRAALLAAAMGGGAPEEEPINEAA